MAVVWAFDFDGVLCDSARETGLSGLKAARVIAPHIATDGLTDERIEQVIAEFCKARPCLETGWEAVLMIIALLSGETSQTLLDFFQSTFKVQLLGSLGTSEDAVKTAFHNARTTWIDANLESWLGAHGFYQDAVDVLKELIEQYTQSQVYVITTKHKVFATQLLEKAGINLPQSHVYGLGSGPKAEVLKAITSGGEGVVFVEDRLATLKSVQQHYPTAQLLLVDWGYNTPVQQQEARQLEITVSSLGSFSTDLSSAASALFQ
eukprot:m.83112 g.83112  ORF g.83112 m.83112 type:complete len:263 (-) comp12712_c0_seq3:37-825(-)